MSDFIPAARPIIGEEERAAVDRVMRSGMLAQGPEVAAFETGVRRALRARPRLRRGQLRDLGLHLGLLAAGVRAGDEVIVPSFTFAATANAVALAGATPVFADIDPETFCLDPAAVEAVDHRPDRRRSCRFTSTVIRPTCTGSADIAEPARTAALRGRRAGPRRLVRRTTGRHLRRLRHVLALPDQEHDVGRGRHGVGGGPRARATPAPVPQPGHAAAYENEVVGLNNRMTDIHAAIGRVQLTKVDAWTQRRQENAAFLSEHLDGVTVPRVVEGATHVYHQYTVRVPEDRDDLAATLRDEHAIGSGMFYPTPDPPSGALRDRRRPARDRGGRARVPVAPGPPVRERRRPRAHRDRGQHVGEGRRMSAAPLRVGLIGIGMMGRNHARVLGSLDGVSLVAVADPAGDPHRAAGTARVVGTVDGADRSTGSTWRSCRRPPCSTSMPVSTSRPPASPPSSRSHWPPTSRRRCSSSTRSRAPDWSTRSGTSSAATRRSWLCASRLEAGELGEIYQVATRRQGPFPNRIADVGVVKDLATHDIDLTAWVIQSPYRTVSAHTAHKSGREHEDLIAITAQMDDGTVASHLVNWLSPLKERVTVVTGERGAFVADTLHGDLTFHENGLIQTEWDQVSTFRGVTEGNITRFAIPKPEPLRVQHENFRDAVLGLPSDIVTMREGLRTVAVADACIQSRERGTHRRDPERRGDGREDRRHRPGQDRPAARGPVRRPRSPRRRRRHQRRPGRGINAGREPFPGEAHLAEHLARLVPAGQLDGHHRLRRRRSGRGRGRGRGAALGRRRGPTQTSRRWTRPRPTSAVT